jgi:uncharacterized membrane protein
MSKTITTANKEEENSEGRSSLEINQIFSGPLPHPQILKGYEEVLPGLADRIMKMAEKQSEHRKEIENTVIITHTKNRRRGLIFAFIITIVAIVVGGLLVYSNHPVGAAVASILPIGSIVGAFIYQKRSDEKVEKQEKL